MSFYAFQKQATFTNSGISPNVLASSLACGLLAPNSSSGAQLEFGFDEQIYVGAKSNTALSTATMLDANIFLTAAADTTGVTAAIQPIELTTTTPTQTVDNYSVMTTSPLGLSAPHYQTNLNAGHFGVEIPTYAASTAAELYCGCAAINQDGSITLSSFITPVPNSQLYCAPEAVFYVQTGSFPVGQIIPYTTEQAAECDFTSGYSVINVTYENDGFFTTIGS